MMRATEAVHRRRLTSTRLFRMWGLMLQAFNGAGDTVTPTLVNLFGFWFLEIPLAYGLAIWGRVHSDGVYFSIVVAEAATR